jgi:hypothetical protein
VITSVGSDSCRPFLKELARKLEELEKKYDAQFKTVLDAIRQLMAPAAPPKRSIGFKVEEVRPRYGIRRVRMAK